MEVEHHLFVVDVMVFLSGPWHPRHHGAVPESVIGGAELRERTSTTVRDIRVPMKKAKRGDPGRGGVETGRVAKWCNLVV